MSPLETKCHIYKIALHLFRHTSELRELANALHNYVSTAHTLLCAGAAAPHAPQGQLGLETTAHNVDTALFLQTEQSSSLERALLSIVSATLQTPREGD